MTDQRCVEFSNREPYERRLTIGEAMGVLSGHCGSIELFLRTGIASDPYATYRVLGTPGQVAERLEEAKRKAEATP
jgi:hypothetical protein